MVLSDEETVVEADGGLESGQPAGPERIFPDLVAVDFEQVAQKSALGGVSGDLDHVLAESDQQVDFPSDFEHFHLHDRVEKLERLTEEQRLALQVEHVDPGLAVRDHRPEGGADRAEKGPDVTPEHWGVGDQSETGGGVGGWAVVDRGLDPRVGV